INASHPEPFRFNPSDSDGFLARYTLGRGAESVSRRVKSILHPFHLPMLDSPIGGHGTARLRTAQVLPAFLTDVIRSTMSPREAFCRQPVWLAISEAAILVGLIGWVDYLTGWEWSFFVFYA